MQLNCTINDAEVQRMLRRVSGQISDPSQLMSRIGQEYEKNVLDNFTQQASPDGKRWPALKDATIKAGLMRKKSHFTKAGNVSKRGKDFLLNKRILIGRGDLEQAVHYQASRNQVIIGVGGHIPYGAIHQFGGPAGRKSKRVMIPARPYLAENDGEGLRLANRDREMIMRLCEGYLAEAVR